MFGLNTAWKVSVFGVFLAHIFQHLDWMQCLSVFSPKWENTDQENSKYGHFLRNETLGIILETSIAKTGIFYALFFKLKFQNMEKIMQ